MMMALDLIRILLSHLDIYTASGCLCCFPRQGHRFVRRRTLNQPYRGWFNHFCYHVR